MAKEKKKEEGTYKVEVVATQTAEVITDAMGEQVSDRELLSKIANDVEELKAKLL